jgi:carbon storage regulator
LQQFEGPISAISKPVYQKDQQRSAIMLVLSRKVGERLLIGDEIAITVVKIQGGGVRIGVEAPASLAIVREELREKLSQQRLSTQDASETSAAPPAGV